MRITTFMLMLSLLIAGCTTMTGTRSIGLTDEAKEAMLGERVMEMWGAQVDGERGRMYNYYDPFFRARVSRAHFAGKAVPVQYFNPHIVQVEIYGNVATVRVSVDYQGTLAGKLGPIDVKKKNNVTNETWLFVDGNWWRQYIDYTVDFTFAKF